MPPVILLVCDEPLWARSVKEILESSGFTVTFPNLTLLHPLDLLRTNEWDICLLSICQRHWDGIEILKVARTEFPARRIFYCYPDSIRMEGALASKMGADGVFPKSIGESDILDIFSDIDGNGRGMRSQLFGEDRGSPKQRNPHKKTTFSPREKQILALVAQGLTYREIAGLTNLSLSTVNTYRRRLIEKIGARTGRELLLFAMKSSEFHNEALKGQYVKDDN